MGYGINILVEGEFALYSRAEFKVERYSYDVITPSAARGILEAVYWKPQISYRILKIHVYNEPTFTTIRRNEVECKVSASDAKKLMNRSESAKGYIDTTKAIQQRASTILRDVKYIIEADFIMTGVNSTEDDTKEKHYNMLLRRLRKGQCYHQAYLGTREFPARISLVEGEIPSSRLLGTRDLGFMLYDMNYTDKSNIVPEFFRAVMKDGVIDLTNVDKVR